MLVVSAALSLNLAIGFAVWSGPFSFAAKLLLTALLAVKCGLFLTCRLGGADRFREAGTVICCLMNLGVAVYGLARQSWPLAVTSVCLFVPLLIQSLALIFTRSGKAAAEAGDENGSGIKQAESL